MLIYLSSLGNTGGDVRKYSKIITVRLDPETLNVLEELTKESKLTRSEVIRVAIGTFYAVRKNSVRIRRVEL
jgi:predicted transcriptional regulator